MPKRRTSVSFFAIASLLFAPVAAVAQHWTPAFGLSPAQFVLRGEIAKMVPPAALAPVKGTIQFAFAVSVPGKALRIRLSNELSNEPLEIGAASIALVQKDGHSLSAMQPLTFGGRPSVTIAAGAPLVSDPIPLAVTSASRVVVRLYLPIGVTLKPLGDAGMLVAPADQTRIGVMTDARSLRGRPLVSDVEVETATQMAVIVAFGDSITDGTVSKLDALHSWPEVVATRLQALPARQRKAVFNAGIGGNRVVSDGWGPAGVARLDRDVLRVAGVSHLVVLEGINDIGMSGSGQFGANPTITPGDIIAGYQQIIARAHARGIKVIGCTLLPFKGAAYYTPGKDQMREEVNRWIRTSRAFDAVVDMDQVMRDPADPLILRAAYDSGDHLHPSEAGYRAMGAAVPLTLFQ